MSDTEIEWTDKVWNPVTGCRPYSGGCVNCYAQVQSHIRGANPQPAMQRKYEGLAMLNGRQSRIPGLIRLSANLSQGDPESCDWDRHLQ